MKNEARQRLPFLSAELEDESMKIGLADLQAKWSVMQKDLEDLLKSLPPNRITLIRASF